MSRLLGIDYGLKRIGVAITDEKRRLAFPYKVFKNDSRTIKKILRIVKEKGIAKIILGLPLNLGGLKPNPILKSTEKFKERLKKASGLAIEFENEMFTTKGAERIQGRHEKIDASAAALILKSYIGREKPV